MTTLAENKAIAGRWFDAFWGKRSDPDVIEELAGPNLVFQSAADQTKETPGELRGEVVRADVRFSKDHVHARTVEHDQPQPDQYCHAKN